MGTDDHTVIRHMNMYLDLVSRSEGRYIVCSECDEEICEVDEGYNDWRDHVPMSKTAVADKMEEYGVWVKERDPSPGETNYDGEIVHMEHYCPGCGTLLHAQPTLESEERPTTVNPEFITDPGQP